MATSPATISVTSTRAMVCAAEARGIRADDVLGRAGVTREFLDEPDARLSAATVMAIWEALRERTGDPALQLRAPAALPWGAYRVIDYLSAASPTVGDGMRRLARFFAIISEVVKLEIDTSHGEHRLVLRTAAGGNLPPMYVDYVFAAIVTRFRTRIRRELRVHRVELRQPRPADPAPWEEVFRTTVVFGSSADCICFSDEEWTAPTDAADEALARLLEEHARIIAPGGIGGASGFRSDVLDAIIAALPEGVSEAAIARALHVSVRTLQRKLTAEETSFREVLDNARSQLAQAYLSDPKVSTSEVAMLLGFSESSSFSRAFRRWTGKSPGRWRRRLAAGS